MDPLVAELYRWLTQYAEGLDMDDAADRRILAEKFADLLDIPEGKYMLHLLKIRHGNFPRQ